MRTQPMTRGPQRVQHQPAPLDALRELLRLEQQSLWTTRRLRFAMLPWPHPGVRWSETPNRGG